MNPLIIVLFILCFSPCSYAVNRIAVAGGSITEIIYQLGEQHRIIGVDSTSTFPPEALKSKPLLGYVRNVSVEGVLSLNPDLLLGEHDTGPLKSIEQLKQTDLTIEILKNDTSIVGIQDKIRHIAALLEVEDKGDKLLADLEVDIAALQHAKKQLKTHPTVLFLLSIRNGTPIAAGHDTSADAVIHLAGGVNALAQEKGWIKLTPEASFALKPDVIIVMNRGDSADLVRQATALAHFKYTPAVKHHAVHAMDGAYLLNFGPRGVQAMIELGTLIHPIFPLPETYQFRYPKQSVIAQNSH